MINAKGAAENALRVGWTTYGERELSVVPTKKYAATTPEGKSVTCEDKTSQPVTLVQFFGDACRVVDYHFIYDGKTGRFLRQCYVQFETREIGVQ
ncbi:unnamed protein product [Camellia sinensis]